MRSFEMLILNLPMQPSCLVHLWCSLGEQDIHAGKQRLHLLEGDEGDRSSKIAFGLFFFLHIMEETQS